MLTKPKLNGLRLNVLRLCLLATYPSGWWFEPLWKILVNWDDYFQYMGIYKNVPNHQPPILSQFLMSHFLWLLRFFRSILVEDSTQKNLPSFKGFFSAVFFRSTMVIVQEKLIMNHEMFKCYVVMYVNVRCFKILIDPDKLVPYFQTPMIPYVYDISLNMAPEKWPGALKNRCRATVISPSSITSRGEKIGMKSLWRVATLKIPSPKSHWLRKPMVFQCSFVAVCRTMIEITYCDILWHGMSMDDTWISEGSLR